MGHTVHPYSFSLGIIRDWKSRWLLEKKLRGMYVAAVEIERSQNDLNLILKTSRPGLLIGRGGEGVEKLKKEIHAYSAKQKIVKSALKRSVLRKHRQKLSRKWWRKILKKESDLGAL